MDDAAISVEVEIDHGYLPTAADSFKTPWGFNYQLIQDTDGNREAYVRGRARDCAEDIKKNIRTGAQAVLEIGLNLLEVKDLIPYGMWGAWLEAEFQWTDRQAQLYMKVAQRFGSNPGIFDLGISKSILYALSAKGTPEDTIAEVVGVYEDGGRLSKREALSSIKASIENHQSSKQGQLTEFKNETGFVFKESQSDPLTIPEAIYEPRSPDRPPSPIDQPVRPERARDSRIHLTVDQNTTEQSFAWALMDNLDPDFLRGVVAILNEAIL